MKKRIWLRETARDLIALGGLPFFVLVLVRVWILDKPEYFLQLAVGGLIFGLAWIWLRQNIYAGLGLIVLVFTSLYYAETLYSVVGGVAYLLLITSLVYLGKSWKNVLLGVFLGIVSVGVSFIYPYLS